MEGHTGKGRAVAVVVVAAGGGVGVSALSPAPAALLVVRPVRLCGTCGQEIENGPGKPRHCMVCLDRGEYYRIPHRKRKAAMRMAVATPSWGPGGLNHQSRIYAEFTMPHRFDWDDD